MEDAEASENLLQPNVSPLLSNTLEGCFLNFDTFGSTTDWDFVPNCSVFDKCRRTVYSAQIVLPITSQTAEDGF